LEGAIRNWEFEDSCLFIAARHLTVQGTKVQAIATAGEAIYSG